MVQSVLALIALETKLIEVVIQSAPHERVQESVELKRIAENYTVNKQLKAKDWSVAYRYLRETQIHQLVFSIDKDLRIKALNRMNSELNQQNIDLNKHVGDLQQRNVELEQRNGDKDL